MFTLEKNNCMYLIDGDMNITKVIFSKENNYFHITFKSMGIWFWSYWCYNQYNKLDFKN